MRKGKLIDCVETTIYVLLFVEQKRGILCLSLILRIVNMQI